MRLWWRKKPQGFDWNEYVRTTIRLRRDQRRARIEDIKIGVAEQARVAGAAAVQGVKSGASGAGHGLKIGVVRGWLALRRALEPFGARVETAGLWLYLQLARPSFALPLVLCGVITVLSGWHGALLAPVDGGGGGSSAAVIVAGFGMLLAAVPSVLTGFGFDVADTDGFAARAVQRLAVPLAAVVMVGGGSWLYGGVSAPTGISGAPKWIGSVVSGLSSRPPVSGKAEALAGDILMIDAQLFRLSGIEALDNQQVCERAGGGKKWKCGEATVAALEKAVGGKTVTCVGYGVADRLGQIEARCEVGGQDLAELQARGGHVFAISQLLGGYGALEDEARGAKRGIWAGTVERPADYRARIWEMAKRASPDGCPIKGQVTSAGRTYVLPWSRSYSRTSIKTRRGDRWFCSEDEAVAAGWSAQRRG